MDIHEIFQLQDRAAQGNIQRFDNWFRWCRRAIELALDSHIFLANNPEMLAYRKHLRDTDAKGFEAMNTVVNLAYDSVGTLISTLRLLEYGVLGDAWALIRVAFESTCYSEFFALNGEKVTDHVKIADKIKRDRSANVSKLLQKSKLGISEILCSLENHDGENRRAFYSRLCNFGAHASPVRVGSRFRLDEPEVRAYLSIGHRELIQCVADYAATAKYTFGIPFEAWPNLMQKGPVLVIRHKALEEEYKHIFTDGPSIAE